MAHQARLAPGGAPGTDAGQPDLAAPFRCGLSATSDNLGYTGATPAHPELLEFLAGELVRSGWSAKALHRLILTSSVYRQSTAPVRRPCGRSRQPAAVAFSAPPARRRGDPRRYAGRAGELDERQGGPYVATNRTESGEVVVDETAAGATRRSVYLQRRRTQIASFLEVFDAPRSSPRVPAACHPRCRSNP